MRHLALTLVAILAFGAFGATPVLDALAADGWAARAKRVRGDVQVERAGARTPLQVGDRLDADDVVVTGDDGGAGLTFIDNTRVSIGPNARLEIARYAFRPGDPGAETALEAKMDRGIATFVSGRITERRPGAMQVRTPAALLGVRGTTFIVSTGTPLDR